MRYISVILPLKLAWEPCYSTDAELHPGDRVCVSFAGRGYVGVVHEVDVEPQCALSAIHGITSVNTCLPPVSIGEIRLWEFMADYYLCTIGEVYKLAFPMLKLNSELKAADNIRRSAERAESTRQKMYANLNARVERLQLRLEKKRSELEKRILLEQNGGVRIKQGMAEVIRKEVQSIAAEIETARSAMSALQTDMPAVGNAAPRTVAKKSAGLPELYVGSSRLDLYAGRAREALSSGTDVLILVPEVAAGEILEDRLSSMFQDDVLLFTSRTTPARRRKTAEALRTSERPYIIVGTRASLFLPFRNLGLVIIDNEQEASYKQNDHTPRYNARDVAVVLARLHGAAVLLGTSCPSLESLYNCKVGKYRDHPDRQIPGSGRMIVDLSAEKRKNGVVGVFSRKLIDIIRKSAGPVAIVYGFEKRDELRKTSDSLFPGIQTELLSYFEAVRTDLSGFAVIALLQADFLTKQEDFRCDERACQTLRMIEEMCRGIFVIQTSKPEHQVFTMAGPESLLPERKMFSLPPFGRIVDVCIADSDEERRSLIASVLKRGLPPQMEIPSLDGIVLRYLFPLGASLASKKEHLRDAVLHLEKERRYYGHISIDVDPLF